MLRVWVDGSLGGGRLWHLLSRTPDCALLSAPLFPRALGSSSDSQAFTCAVCIRNVGSHAELRGRIPWGVTRENYDARILPQKLIRLVRGEVWAWRLSEVSWGL